MIFSRMRRDSSLAFARETSYIPLVAVSLMDDSKAMVNKRIKICVGGLTLEAELKSNKTAEAVYAALPIETGVNTWGDEFYLKLPGVKDYRETATTQVKVGDIALWGAGEVLAIFFGRTPMSLGPDPVPVDRVNVIGRIVGEADQLRQVMGATTIKLERA